MPGPRGGVPRPTRHSEDPRRRKAHPRAFELAGSSPRSGSGSGLSRGATTEMGRPLRGNCCKHRVRNARDGIVRKPTRICRTASQKSERAGADTPAEAAGKVRVMTSVGPGLGLLIRPTGVACMCVRYPGHDLKCFTALGFGVKLFDA
jgi:hypothetical protein